MCLLHVYRVGYGVPQHTFEVNGQLARIVSNVFIKEGPRLALRLRSPSVFNHWDRLLPLYLLRKITFSNPLICSLAFVWSPFMSSGTQTRVYAACSSIQTLCKVTCKAGLLGSEDLTIQAGGLTVCSPVGKKERVNVPAYCWDSQPLCLGLLAPFLPNPFPPQACLLSYSLSDFCIFFLDHHMPKHNNSVCPPVFHWWVSLSNCSNFT